MNSTRSRIGINFLVTIKIFAIYRLQQTIVVFYDRRAVLKLNEALVDCVSNDGNCRIVCRFSVLCPNREIHFLQAAAANRFKYYGIGHTFLKRFNSRWTFWLWPMPYQSRIDVNQIRCAWFLHRFPFYHFPADQIWIAHTNTHFNFLGQKLKRFS